MIDKNASCAFYASQEMFFAVFFAFLPINE